MADSGAPPGENLTLAQIAAQQTAAMQAMQGRGRGRGRGRGGDPKPKKLTKAQIAAQERAAAAHAAQAAAVASAAPQIPMHQMPGVPTQMPPPGVPVPQQQQQQAPGPGGGPPRPPPLRQRSPVDVQNELRQNLELIKREMVESKNAFDRTGRTYEPPKYVVKAQFDAAIGVELWLDDHSKNFDANELAKKIAMLQGIQTKCAKGILDENPFEALCCWVELTKTYYICVRESRNLTMRGVGGIVPPTFALPVDSPDPPPAIPDDDVIPTHELDEAMFQIVGPKAWVEAVQEDLLRRVGIEGVAPTYAASLRKGKEKGQPGGGGGGGAGEGDGGGGGAGEGGEGGEGGGEGDGDGGGGGDGGGDGGGAEPGAEGEAAGGDATPMES